MIGTMDGLANAAKTSAGGMPNLLQLAMIGRDCRTRLVRQAAACVQRANVRAAGALGRRCGFGGTYLQY
jgi:hypothetical protein